MKKRIALFTAVLLLFCLLTGCAEKPSTETSVPDIVKKTNGGEKWQTKIDYANGDNWLAINDSGTVDGLTYKYLGVPFENARKAKVFKKIGEGKIAVNGSSCYLELEQNLDNYAIVIIEGNNLRGNKSSGTAAIVSVLSVESLTATSGDTVGELLTAYSSDSPTNKVSVAISGISNRACIYLYRDYIDTSYFQASKYLYFKSDYALLDEATFTVWGFEK